MVKKRKITKNGRFPNTTKATGKYSGVHVFLDEYGNDYDLASANKMIKKGFPMARYKWYSPRGYELDKE